MRVRVVTTLLLSLCCSAALLRAQTVEPAAAAARLTGQEFSFERRTGIVYAEHGGRALRLDLYLPDGPGPHPAAMVIHGGGWKTGGRAILDAAALARGLAREGLATASISYRLAPGFDHPAQIEDCRSAMQFLRAEADELGLDPTRIAVIGASAGGHLAALLATEGERAQADAADARSRLSTLPTCAVTICAPFDLLPALGRTPSTMEIQVVSELLGLDEVEDVARRVELLHDRGRRASPLYHVSAGDRPMLIVDGQRDWLVVPAQADRMLLALEAVDVPHRHFRIADGGHCEFLLRESREWTVEPPPFWRAIRAFLRVRLLAHDRRELQRR